MPEPVRTAVFPVAGRGTRFLPATKAVPKEMLPVVDKPLIQYAVEEAVAAGATRLVFITHSSKGAIESHFDGHDDLEEALADSGKQDILAVVQGILPDDVTCEYVLQGEPLGLGHAVLCAREAVGEEPFYVHLPDDLILSEQGCLSQLNDHYQATGGSCVAVEEIPPEKTSSYGVAAVDGDYRISEIVEKPQPDVAPSNLGVVGRYLLTPAIFARLEKTGQGSGGEIQLTDGIASLMAEEAVYATAFKGTRYDCGDKLGYIMANIDFALERDDLAEGLRAHLATL
ncbi:MAG: UTP--glucose-1-phosphate uridylyltransferase GalU [Gammaproteobacteria bacterium]|jgi:UTP--glucose-1-phosphate uridylyltransferase|nr:UTP--glucose-1-phosphate uridylyltransferase GalU [Gammaproteobacteria bacterium]MDP6616368.1 UTP--glucose-1-phosphate uridylyltransferase GalU [Gammaproteobacteria bacterium]MDP6695340.1 UTP--glucose-1-phosphate uridylyltransferase GalU [Gammaproteobacteria bacterium]MDP7041883.1 UTP--glucose-1-phosphate uridylyltransferase GalU [Gammaproteobacteria bacterium]